MSNGIDELVAAGILHPLTASRRNRSWEAAGLLDLVVGLESGEGQSTETSPTIQDLPTLGTGP